MQYTKDSEYVRRYSAEMYDIFSKMHPEWDEKKLKQNIDNLIEEQLQDITVTVSNNYTKHSAETTLISVFDWFYKKRPILAGNATFYKRQSESFNPDALMLLDMLKDRKAVKREMFKVDDDESYEYKTLDRKQQNIKRGTNSHYGGSGAPHSSFYSEFSIPATTGAAQSIISSTLWLFEPLLGDNYVFSDLNEVFHWMQHVLRNCKDLEPRYDLAPATREELFERMKSKLFKWKNKFKIVLTDYIESLTDWEVTLIFYHNNLIEFMNRNPFMIDIVKSILNKIKDVHPLNELDPTDPIPEGYDNLKAYNKYVKGYNKSVYQAGFYDPNDPPEDIKEDLNAFYDNVRKYCYVPYLAFDRIWKLKNIGRNVATIIDTDSNILSLDIIMRFLMDKTINLCSYNKGREQNEIILINTITYSITNAVAELLNYYATMANIDPDYRKYISMKNEFFMNRLFTGLSKKRYFSSIKLREGNLLKKPKQDIKGFEIMKSVVAGETASLYKRLIKQYFLDSPVPMVRECMQELIAFKNEVTESIASGETRFLPVDACKDLDSFDEPGSQPSVRGSIIWNKLYPDNAIEYPSRCPMLKMAIYKESDIDKLKTTDPDIYAIIIDTIFNDDTGIYVTRKTDKNGKTTIKSKGMTYLAIPSNGTIPKWCTPYIDYTSLVNTVLAPFNPILEIFGIPAFTEGKTTGNMKQTERFSNIIKF